MFGHELVHGWRRLRATPLFTLFAVATLAAGIGATTAVYSLVRYALGPPSGVKDPATLAYLFHYPAGSVPMHAFAWPDYRDYSERQTSFSDVAAFGATRQTVAGADGAVTDFMEVVSGRYFDVLGVDMALGRALQPQDDEPGAPFVVVLSQSTWLRTFGGRADVIGQPVRIAGHVFEVVGVAPREFRGLFNSGVVASSAWVPLGTAHLFESTGMADRADDRTRRWLRGVGRLAPGTSMTAAQAELTAIAGQLDAAFPLGTDISDARFRAPYRIGRPWALRAIEDVPLNIGAASMVTWMAAIVMVAVGLVFMVACSNLANLMLARGAGRRQEMGVRLALGASRARLVRASIAESLLLAGMGGLGGVLLARVLIVVLTQEIPVGNVSLIVSPRLDAMVLLASVVATLLALLVAGIGPVLQSSRTDVRGVMASERAQGGRARWIGRRLLITGQVAVSVMLLAVASMFIGQLRADARVDSGLDVEHMAVAEVDFGDQGFDEVRTRQVMAQVLGQLGSRPDVESVAVSSGLPMGLTTPGSTVTSADSDRIAAEFVAATPGILDALGVTILSGRGLDARDTAGADAVIVVSEGVAMRAFGRTDVVGQQVEVQRRRWVGETTQQPAHMRTIVGVASGTSDDPSGADSGTVYLPIDQQFEDRLVFTVRAGNGRPEDLIGPLRSALRSAAPELGLSQIGTGRSVVAPPNMFAIISSVLAGALGVFALGLALAGLYGVLTHLMARRTREIGLRMALGASRRDILVLVARQGLWPVLLGIAAGVVLGWLARGILQPGVRSLVPTVDVMTMLVLPVLLLLAGALACYLPARRASRVDPNVALRTL